MQGINTKVSMGLVVEVIAVSTSKHRNVRAMDLWKRLATGF
jgi:hypothetical protein